MSKSFIAPGLPQMTPYLIVKDPDESIVFYEKAFGFKLSPESPLKDHKGQTTHVHMIMEDVHIMFGRENDFDIPNQSPKSSRSLPGSIFYIYCPDVDAKFTQAVSGGAKPVLDPQDSYWGDRLCKVTDMDGYEWSFATFTGQVLEAPL